MYRIGLTEQEVPEETLKRSGFRFVRVKPREQMVTSVKRVLGRPYKRGASVLKDAPGAFECSSLIAWAAVESGFSIPRVSVDQFVFAKKIERKDLKPGDLVFTNTKEIIHTEGEYYSQVLGKVVKEEPIRYVTLEYLPGTKVPHGVDHVGIYVGDNKIVHATCKRGEVVEDDLIASSSFQNIVGYGRIIDSEDDRFVVELPDNRPELRKKENLIKELENL